MPFQISINDYLKYGNLNLIAKKLVEGFITGIHKSPYHGFSVEFSEHRLYNDGESTKNIDWKVFAKTDKLFTKRFEEETNLRCHILLDVSSSMYYPIENKGKITFSAMCIAAIATLLQKQRDGVGLITFSDKIETEMPIKSTSLHKNLLIQNLETIINTNPTKKQTNTSEVINLIANKIHKRSLVVIFSDMFEDISNQNNLFSSLQHLQHNNHEILLFHVTDKNTELNFNFSEKPYLFEDIETGEIVKLRPNEIKKTYIEQSEKYYQELKNKCGQYKIDFIEADISDGFNTILQSYLSKRAKMK
jgi:uncharacterized protein (DUF58 family)